MAFRDDLEAAHARIAALEAQLSEQRGTAAATSSEREVQWHAERSQLISHIAELERTVTERGATITQLRGERDRLVERINILQRERTKQPAAPAPAPAVGSTKKWPLLWDHNRKFDPVGGGRAANVACPQCWFENVASEMMRDTGLEPVAKSDNAYVDVVAVVCPRCLFAAPMRTR
jgi:uncharacterized coiled-coil protein SlyX